MQRWWRNIGALDLVNFFLADVRDAFGPYLGVFLVTQQQWNQAAVGLVATVGGLAGLAVQAPWGALIDAARCKRALIVTGLTVLALGAVAVAWRPSFAVVMTSKTAMAVAGAGFGPAVAAMTLGLCPTQALAWRLGRMGRPNPQGCRRCSHADRCWYLHAALPSSILPRARWQLSRA